MKYESPDVTSRYFINMIFLFFNIIPVTCLDGNATNNFESYKLPKVLDVTTHFIKNRLFFYYYLMSTLTPGGESLRLKNLFFFWCFHCNFSIYISNLSLLRIENNVITLVIARTNASQHLFIMTEFSHSVIVNRTLL